MQAEKKEVNRILSFEQSLRHPKPARQEVSDDVFFVKEGIANRVYPYPGLYSSVLKCYLSYYFFLNCVN